MVETASTGSGTTGGGWIRYKDVSYWKEVGFRGMRGLWPGWPVIPVGHADEADNGYLELRREHGVRGADMGTIQKERLSHDKSLRERQETKMVI